MPSEDTRERLLDAAEELYADHGIDATSLRTITARAQANLAAVNYHFGSKEALTLAVLARRIAPINAERIEALDALAARGDAATVEDVLRAFLRPALDALLARDGAARRFTRLMGRIHSEPDPTLQQRVFEHFHDTVQRFREAFAAALPDLSPSTLAWRMHFVIGCMAHTLASPALLERLSEGACDASDVDAVLEEMLSFLVAGMQAPGGTR